MKLLTAQQLKEWDLYTIQHGRITSTELMERAASLCAEKISFLLKHETNFNSVVIFCGPGNNGGDGLVIARKLTEQGFAVSVYVLGEKEKHSVDFVINRERLPQTVSVHTIQSESDIPLLNEHTLVVDALLGYGLNRPIAGITAQTIDHINTSEAYVVSIDMPSGLPAEVTDNTALINHSIIEATCTYTFQVPKFSFLHTETYQYTGAIEVLDIGLLPEFLDTIPDEVYWVTPDYIQRIYKPRLPFSHKGSFGHALIVAGSYGKLGAAVLASKASLRTGCGLVTAFVPKVGFTVLQTALPEAMVQTDEELYEIRNFPDTTSYAAVGVGPGIGTIEFTEKGFSKWIQQIHQPIVIDADGLNICAMLIQKDKHFRFPQHCILTPHPKEFDRLAGHSQNSFERHQKQIAFAKKYNVTVVLKGAYTCTVSPDGKVFYNSSGNVTLATAGSGDVLTGIITSLLAQQYTMEEAAVLGVYLHGICADLWVEQGNETMIAGDIVEMIPKALYRLFN